MKIQIPDKQRNRPRPMVPTVALTDEAYDALAELSANYDTSMRMLASAIIMNAYKDIEIEKGGSANG